MGELESMPSVVLWEHEDPESTFMWHFLQQVNRTFELHLKSYDELHAWSIRNVPEFWGLVWNFTGMLADVPYSKVSRSASFSCVRSF
jgi:acetoacetyl-CoA synthetase